MTGDMKWKGGPFARDRLSGAQAGRGVLWVLAGSLDSILRAGGVAVLVDTRATLAETNKSFCSLEKKAGAAWLLSLVRWFVGLSSGLSTPVVEAEATGGLSLYSRQLLFAFSRPE